MVSTRYYKSIYDNDYSNEFFRQFDLLKENMKEINFFLSLICRIIFNTKKYSEVEGLTNDDLLSIQMLSQLKDRKENNTLKEVYKTNQIGTLEENLDKNKQHHKVNGQGSKELQTITLVLPEGAKKPKSNLYSQYYQEFIENNQANISEEDRTNLKVARTRQEGDEDPFISQFQHGLKNRPTMQENGNESTP